RHAHPSFNQCADDISTIIRRGGSPMKQSTIVGSVVVSAMLLGCFAAGPKKRVATPAELDQFGTRTYAGYDKAAVQQAAVTALKVQGYEVVTTEPRIRTSPKLVHVSTQAQYSDYAGSSQSFAEMVAWDIDVNDGQQ